MIGARNITLAFGQQAIFTNQTFSILPHQKIGLVGRNGAGKSTLLKIIAGLQNLDEGSITIDKGRMVAYLPQELVVESTKMVFDEALDTFRTLVEQRAELQKLEAQLNNADHEITEHYAQLISHFSESDYNTAQLETKRVLQGLGFKEKMLNQPVSQLSLGWQMRLILAKLLLQKADFYLFDEPTNHLDIVAKDWFLDFLNASDCGFLLVSHDRFFLDHACEQILEMENGKVTFYRGNYTSYLEQKEKAIELIQKAYEEQQREIRRKTETIDRFRAKASKATMAQAMIKQLEKMELIELPQTFKVISIVLPSITQPGKIVLTAEKLSKTFDHNTIFKNASLEIVRGEKVALVAANGTGKSTLFNLLSGKYAIETGSIKMGHNVTMALFEQDQNKSLNPNNTILQEIEEACPDSQRRSMARTLLGSFLFPGDDVYKRISVLSGGEKNRVAMVKVLLTHANLLLLDEPTNHLDIQSKEILLKALQEFKGTLLFVSHDRDFLDKLATRILELTPAGVFNYPGNYESYLYQKKHQQTAPAIQQQQSNKQQPKVEGSSSAPSSGRDAYERKKRIASLERTIGKLDEKIATLYAQLGTLEWGSPEHQQAEAQLQAAKQQRDTATKEWEKLIG